jgi:hypothetical protein
MDFINSFFKERLGARVARFLFVQYTKTRKIYTKWPQNILNVH